MRWSDLNRYGLRAHERRPATRTFSAAGGIMRLENRLMPAITLGPPTLPGDTGGIAYNHTVTASGGAGGYHYAVTSGALPKGLSLNTSTGAIAGTPFESLAGKYAFTITATDASHATGARAYSITVNPVMTFNTNFLFGGAVDAPFRQQLTVTGGTRPVTFKVTKGMLTPGLTLSPSGLVSGTPSTAGQFNFTITATDAVGSTTSARFDESVAAVPFVFKTSSVPDATINTSYRKQLVATGGASPDIKYAVTSGTLPTGLTLSSAGLLSGSPTAAGTYGFTVTASYVLKDDSGTTTGRLVHAFTMTVRPTITTAPTVTDLQRFGFRNQPTIFVLTFSTAMNPIPAQNVNNYTLVTMVNGVARAPIRLSSAVYDAAKKTVTLRATNPVYLFAHYRLTVNGTSPTGLTSTSGIFLAGTNGQAGTNYVRTFGKEILAGPNTR